MFLSHDGIEVIDLKTNLAAGELNSCRAKFALSQQKAVLQRLLDDLEQGRIPRGDWRKGEIEIVGLERIVINRFWHEPEWKVLFPPKASGGEPVAGTYRWQEWNVGVDSGAAALCMTSKREIVLLNSYRHAMRRWRLEIPRGVRRADETLEACALRESLEEAGVKRTAATEVINLGRLNPDTGLSRQEPQLVCYTNVEVDETRIRRDSSEAIAGHVLLGVETVEQMILQDKIRDSFTIAALFRARAGLAA